VSAGCNTQSSSNKGKEGQELTLRTAKTVTIDQDDTAKIEVTVERKKFDEPVTIKFETPEGVTVAEGDTKLDKGEDKRTFILKASDKAKVGQNKMTVVASSGDMKDRNEVTLEIKAKGTSSTSGSSPVSGTDAEIKAKREELGTAIKTKMKEIDASMAALSERAKTADAQVKEKLNERIEELKTERQNLKSEYDRVETTTAANWNDFSTRLTKAANKLAEGARKALDQFKK
jgi:hypothetical protein